MFLFGWVCGDNLKIDCENIPFFFILNQVYVVSALQKNQQNCLKSACDVQREIESKVCVVAS